jgi:MATE family multidrug resistance protein
LVTDTAIELCFRQSNSNYVFVISIIALISNGINILLAWLFVHYFDWGYLGAAYARSIAAIFLPLGLVIYVSSTGVLNRFWDGWNKEALSPRGIKQYLGLALPGMLMMVLKWWAFEVLVVFAGLLHNSKDALGASAVLFNLSSLSYMFFLGVSVSVTIRYIMLPLIQLILNGTDMLFVCLIELVIH